jgi:hypothetical protein
MFLTTANAAQKARLASSIAAALDRPRGTSATSDLHGQGEREQAAPLATADVGPRRRFPELLQRQWRAVGFVLHVASVRPTCYRCLTRMLQGFRADVAKVDLDVSTLWMLIPQHNV